jgi:DNA-binding MarR family transcriptional regulator
MNQIEQHARAILRHYPRIYIACHSDHTNRKGKGPDVSARDQTILAHIPDSGVRPQHLAQHLDISASTLSEALKRLVDLGLVTLSPTPGDARGRLARLTDAGQAALASTSVLDIRRVRAALASLPADQRVIVVQGLSLLADAAQAVERD